MDVKTPAYWVVVGENEAGKSMPMCITLTNGNHAVCAFSEYEKAREVISSGVLGDGVYGVDEAPPEKLCRFASATGYSKVAIDPEVMRSGNEVGVPKSAAVFDVSELI